MTGPRGSRTDQSTAPHLPKPPALEVAVEAGHQHRLVHVVGGAVHEADQVREELRLVNGHHVALGQARVGHVREVVHGQAGQQVAVVRDQVLLLVVAVVLAGLEHQHAVARRLRLARTQDELRGLAGKHGPHDEVHAAGAERRRVQADWRRGREREGQVAERRQRLGGDSRRHRPPLRGLGQLLAVVRGAGRGRARAQRACCWGLRGARLAVVLRCGLHAGRRRNVPGHDEAAQGRRRRAQRGPLLRPLHAAAGCCWAPHAATSLCRFTAAREPVRGRRHRRAGGGPPGTALPPQASRPLCRAWLRSRRCVFNLVCACGGGADQRGQCRAAIGQEDSCV